MNAIAVGREVIDESFGGEAAQSVASNSSQQRNVPPGQSFAAQPSTPTPTSPTSDHEDATVNEISDDLFDLLCTMAHKHPEDHDNFVTAVDMLNEMRQMQDVDLVYMQTKVDRDEEKIVGLEKRIDVLSVHVDEQKTYYKNELFHAEYDARILRAELQHAKRDQEESKNGEAERKLKDQIHTLEARLSVANGHLYGSSGKFAKKER